MSQCLNLTKQASGVEAKFLRQMWTWPAMDFQYAGNTTASANMWVNKVYSWMLPPYFWMKFLCIFSAPSLRDRRSLWLGRFWSSQQDRRQDPLSPHYIVLALNLSYTNPTWPSRFCGRPQGCSCIPIPENSPPLAGARVWAPMMR